MTYKLALVTRVQIALISVTIFVGSLLTLITDWTLETIEQEILASQFDANADWIISLYRRAPDRFLQNDYGPVLYVDAPSQSVPATINTAPTYTKDLLDGWHEVESGVSDEYYVYIRTIDGARYTVVSDMSAYEKREHVTMMLLTGAGLVCVMMAALLSRFIARKTIKPLTRLAQEVRDETVYPLSPRYGLDEVGLLATSLDEQLSAIRSLLARERWFTGDVSHELRTPLMIVEGAVAVIQEKLDRGQTHLDDIMPALHRIKRAQKEMQMLVGAFLKLARHRDSAMPIEQDSYELNTTIDAIISTYQVQFGEVRLEISPASKPVWINAPEHFLKIVIGNLVRNALQHGEGGTISINWTSTCFTICQVGEALPAKVEEMIGSENQHPYDTPRVSGLGLAIVLRLSRFAGWTLQYQRQSPLNVFTLYWNDTLIQEGDNLSDQL